MAERSGVAWLQRLWRRTEQESGAHPGTPAVLPVEQALVLLDESDQVFDAVESVEDYWLERVELLRNKALEESGSGPGQED